MHLLVLLSTKKQVFVFSQTNTLPLSALFVCKQCNNQIKIKVINTSCGTRVFNINFA